MSLSSPPGAVRCEECLTYYHSHTPNMLPRICPRCLSSGDFRVDLGAAQ